MFSNKQHCNDITETRENIEKAEFENLMFLRHNLQVTSEI